MQDSNSNLCIARRRCSNSKEEEAIDVLNSNTQFKHSKSNCNHPQLKKNKKRIYRMKTLNSNTAITSPTNSSWKNLNHNATCDFFHCSMHKTTKMLFSMVLGLSLLLRPVSAGFPQFLSYQTCVDGPPQFSDCMVNVTADLGERVVLNCQVIGPFLGSKIILGIPWYNYGTQYNSSVQLRLILF